jgi:hypothetical protein
MIGSDTFIMVALRCSESGVELLQGGPAHHRRGNDVAGIDGHFLEHAAAAGGGVGELDGESANPADDRGLLVGVEVAVAHRRDVRFRVR